MEYKKLEEMNKLLKTTNIKGKDYVEVNERVKAWWNLCENGKIETDILSLENGVVVIKAKVYEDRTDNEPRATGIAYEKEGTSFINSTSYIENCETSAIGRALGNAGIGIDTSIASAEEVGNAILQQESMKKITPLMEKALRQAIQDKEIENDRVIELLKELGHTKLEEITTSEVVEFRKKLGV